ncbi:hypothetical protein RUM43_009641 [Polyplax serrata]|uniref:Phosphatidylinositol N-acetylglucosaminyltransferase subunit P n=1 Tax=Polyplax serrata TaxID=468196 RepID=A0AAN8P264_POLSC
MGEHTPAPTPSRGVYGFALYLICLCGLVVYTVWAAVPDCVLHSLGISYYPQKYWAIALPVYCMMALAVFAFFIYPSMNLLLTPALDDMKVVTDSHAMFRECDKNATLLHCGGGEESNVHGIPPASDIQISHVCKTLYLN